MKINQDTVIYGRFVALLPYAPHHVAKRHQWLKEDSNRLDRSAKPPSLEEEKKRQQELTNSNECCMFLVADVDALCNPNGTENDALIGEVHLRFSPADKTNAALEMMLTVTSVKRKSCVSETLLLVFRYGAEVLNVHVFVHELHDSKATDNRLVFVGRPEPPKEQKSIVKKVGKSIKKAFRKKTDLMDKLTRHLLKQDEGEHWPMELDFELVGPGLLELPMVPEVQTTIDRYVQHAQLVTYRSVHKAGTLLSPDFIRMDGWKCILVPYKRDHVSYSHEWMQRPDMYTALGRMPPTLDEETTAQSLMEADPSCHTFVLLKVDGAIFKGSPTAKVNAMPCGRAQVIINGDVAQLVCGIALDDLEEKAALQQEMIVLCLIYAFTVLLNIQKVVVPKTLHFKPSKDPEGNSWPDVLNFTTSKSSETLRIVRSDDVVKELIRISEHVRFRTYNVNDFSFSGASAI